MPRLAARRKCSGFLRAAGASTRDRFVRLAEPQIDGPEVGRLVGGQGARLGEFLQPFGGGEVVVAKRRDRHIARPLEARGAERAVVDQESAQPARQFGILLAGVVEPGASGGREGTARQRLQPSPSSTGEQRGWLRSSVRRTGSPSSGQPTNCKHCGEAARLLTSPPALRGRGRRVLRRRVRGCSALAL